MAVHSTILARELSACGGSNAVCNGASWNSARRVNTSATRVIPAARIQSAPITVLPVSSP
jgi:hypothetical protein